ncbi:hypothetical protein H8L32_07505 [Undibacterium sp. CY18W]|uniref:Uncharacterized protein n=1 Tax=Undibacterium hunanense TaxID=2762292 RepID=A0ABR6ZN49_9BURK|nr:hypothetical protein [Undibacterium hunanense]MBC3917316.1 hypothetical protein [Undibacterium hunanense]
MNKNPVILARLTVVFFFFSVTALILSRVSAVCNWGPYIVCMHVSLFLLGAYEIWLIRKFKKEGLLKSFKYLLELPKILLAALVVTIILLLPTFLRNPYDFGALPDGTIIYQKFLFEENGKYYSKLNKLQSIEITKDNYCKEQNRFFEVFASFWILAGYFELVAGYYIVKRKKNSVER